MNFRSMLAGAAAVALLATAAQAQSTKDFPEVSDTSFREADGSHVLRLSLVLPASRAAVWQRLSTAEGYKTWATPVAKIDFGVGGMIEASYDSHAKIGDADNIRNRIIAYAPDHLMVLKNENAPHDLPSREEFKQVVTILELEDAPGGTRITLTGVGYKPTPAFDTLYQHFGWGNAYTLMKLKESIVKGPLDWKKLEARAQAQAAVKTVQGSR